MFWKLFVAMVAVLTVALALLVITPASVSYPFDPAEALELGLGFAVLLGVCAWVIRSGLRPLADLREAMDRRDELSEPERVPVTRSDEVGRVAAAYNALLDRLSTQKLRASALAISAQEDERRRISRELHDEVGQTLTAVLLRLQRLESRTSSDIAEEVRGAAEVTRTALQEVRRVVARLRPGVLDDLGLVSALTALATETAGASGVVVHRAVHDVPGRTPDQDLVIYRVAQEALTNVVRHAQARHARLALGPTPGGLILDVTDDGVGLSRPAGNGRNGMQERAWLIGGRLTVGPGPEGGTQVKLFVPMGEDPGTRPQPTQEPTP
ncbi:MAG: HAMP domain-containing protein [Austwickia sp.]|jgi:two-component system sensor histidine kinase UhpB|nr:HAMP domain-containing protein [Austwickia sp.]MBK8434975.1 HAMP domain-containing protein [Austwickia sp.]MBK9101467.1 HAMP domain-containing protein [Austwickia sp.]